MTAVELSEEAWSPFGWMPVEDTDERDGGHRLEFSWYDVHVNVIGHSRDEVAPTPDGMRCDVMFRHQSHTQSLLVLNCDVVIGVAPPGWEFSGPDPLGAVSAFIVRPLQAVVLHRGTWHWGPYPLGAEPVRLFNIQGLRYREDNESVDLAGRDIPVEIVVPR